MIPVGLLQPPDRVVQVAPIGDAVSRDLVLDELFTAMAVGDDLIGDVVKSVVAESLTDSTVIRYRRNVLANFCARPEMLRELYLLSREATTVRRWTIGRRAQPRSKLVLALQPLECSSRICAGCGKPSHPTDAVPIASPPAHPRSPATPRTYSHGSSESLPARSSAIGPVRHRGENEHVHGWSVSFRIYRCDVRCDARVERRIR